MNQTNQVLKSCHDQSDTSEDWYSTWLTNSPCNGTISGWTANSSGVIPYSAEAETTGEGAGDFTIPLNATAMADMLTLNTWNAVIMTYDYDYLDTAPTGYANNLGIYFRDYHASRAPTIAGNYFDFQSINGLSRIKSINGIFFY